MDKLYKEALSYLTIDFGSTFPFMYEEVKPEDIKRFVKSYKDYYNELLVGFTISKNLRKYINKERMVFDAYNDGKIMVLKYDPKDHTDEPNEEFFSDSEVKAADKSTGFINGVRLYDEFDFREQLTANEFTGGYWEPQWHWVVDLEGVEEMLEQMAIKKAE
jgi:hypothetical protein